jgi:hypothetical protein
MSAARAPKRTWVSVADAARLVGQTPWWIYTLARRGQIPVRRRRGHHPRLFVDVAALAALRLERYVERRARLCALVENLQAEIAKLDAEDANNNSLADVLARAAKRRAEFAKLEAANTTTTKEE